MTETSFSESFLPDDIKEIRNKTGMTQKEFCSNFGITLSTLRHWERGDRKPHGTALVLLNLIENSPKEVYSILQIGHEKGKHDMFEKKYLKGLILQRKGSCLEDILSLGDVNIIFVLTALTISLGIPYCKVRKSNNIYTFIAGYDEKHLREVLNYDIEKKELSGELKESISKAYQIIFAIEHELTDAVYLPPEMRHAQIEAVIKKTNTDSAFYTTILKNW